jgi:hypothetical protein
MAKTRFKKLYRPHSNMKCDICKQKVEETFLGKIKGSYIGSGKKKKVVCQACQKTNSFEEIKKKLK